MAEFDLDRFEEEIDSEIRFNQRQKVKRNIRESLKNGNVDLFKNNIFNYGDFKWSKSEFHELFPGTTIDWKYEILKILIDDFNYLENNPHLVIDLISLYKDDPKKKEVVELLQKYKK